MIDDNVYLGKGKIKGIALISKKYWDEGNLISDENNLQFTGKKSSTTLAKEQVKNMEWVKHRGFKVIRITKQNGEFYHISSVLQSYYADPEDGFAEAELQNTKLFNVVKKFLNL